MRSVTISPRQWAAIRAALPKPWPWAACVADVLYDPPWDHRDLFVPDYLTIYSERWGRRRQDAGRAVQVAMKMTGDPGYLRLMVNR